ncbi:hypothetical protein [Leisingera sp. M658]|uniref:hypothetical protein n=1 Tax=Leisingera sp. M658 TaxID=2867015 RepID=UPI0021A7BAD3|nr:hypothetical protein [Leisingera sp. M658]UWQ77059.1 hypothetical protein K3724_11930 [Leisingera sp. M658]
MTAETQRSQIEFLDEEIDHTDQMITADPIFKPFRKQCCLIPIYALDKTCQINSRCPSGDYHAREFPHSLGFELPNASAAPRRGSNGG